MEINFVTNKEKCDTDKNGYKKSYRLYSTLEIITMQTKKLKNIMSQVNVLILF